MSRPATVYIGLGSNLGDRRGLIRRAVEALGAVEGVTVVEQSDLYETEPVGGPPQPKFLNGAVGIETSLTPRQLMDELLTIERALARTRTSPNAPRAIDLDLLLYGDTVIDEEALRVPHPRMHERWFVLKPLADIAPDARHPVLSRTVKELLREVDADAR